MSHAVMITTPAGNAMEGNGLTDARTILASDADLYPERQGQSITGRAVAYSVYCPATERFSLVTLDGRWIIPGREGYKTRGPVKSFARKNIADVRPDGMVILEPVRHNGRYAMTRYGQRRSGICRGTVSMDRYGYKCTCGETLSFRDIHREGWMIVSDGRSGTHTQAYAVRSSDAVEWSADVPMSYDAPVAVGAPESAPVEAPAPVEAAAETAAPVEAVRGDGTALPFGTYRPNVPGARTLRDARPLVIGGRTVTAVVESSGWTLFAGGEILATGDAREISGDACEWFAARAMAETAETTRPGVVWERDGNGAYGAKRHVVTVDGRWSFRVDVTGPDRNGLESFSAPLLLVAGRDKGVKVPSIQVADFQTYDRAACESDIQAWLNTEVRARETRHAELVDAGKTPRPAEYRAVCGECRIKDRSKTRCECTGGKSWAHAERDRAGMERVLKVTRKAAAARAAGKDAPAGFFGWSVPTRTAEWAPVDYAPGTMLTWDVEGVTFTGQVWAADCLTGEWSGSSYASECDVVIIATVDGRPATRAEAVAVPFWHGSRRGTPYAHVSVPNGENHKGEPQRYRADVAVIGPECASDGLFDVESAPEVTQDVNGPENGAETAAPIDPAYSLDVAEGERVFTRPGFAEGGSYEGRAAVLRGVVTVADARAAVERFPETVRTVGGAVVDGAIVPMGCAMLSALATVRTDAGYVVTLPDGTAVTGTWVECGNAFAEWAITQRPEFVCAMAEGHADGAATLARISAEVRAQREQAEAEAAQAAADVTAVAAALDRVWSVWRPYLDDLTNDDEDRVWGVDEGARVALRYARAAVERNDAGAAVHYVNEAREGVAWLEESARRSGLTVPDAPAEVPVPVAAPVRALPDVDSAPDAIEAWEGEGGACVGVGRPSAPDAGSGAVPGGTDPSPEMGTCTAPDVDTWDGQGGALPGVEIVRVPSAQERGADDPYAVGPTAPEWAPVLGTDRRIAELTCAGRQYRVDHVPDAVLPYTVRYTLGGADVDLGGWVGLDDVRAIVRADRRRSAALEADRRRVEREQRRAAYRLQGERRQATVRLTAEDRLAIARRTEEEHRPVTAELYVSPITGRAVLAWVCGTCDTTHDDHLWRPQTIGESYRTPLSVEQGTLAALVEKRGWRVTDTWTAHGTRGDTLRARIAPTPAYLAWVDATYGPDPATPEVEAGERIVPVQRGWWDVVSKEGHRYELTVRPTLTGPAWSVRHRSAEGFETVTTTGMAGTVLIGMRAHSAKRDHQGADEGRPESVHVPLAS